MKLTKIAIKNVKSSIGMYKLYLLSLIFTVVVFFLFIALYNNPMMQQLEENYIFQSLIIAALFVMMVFVIFFLIFSTKFFISERQKEIGLYMMTGTPKYKIASMVAVENMIMYVLAIVIGSSLGMLLNKFFVMIITNYLNMGITIDFYVSHVDVLTTFIVFIILGLVTSVRGFILVNQKKVIDLIKGKNKEETMPRGNVLIGLISIVIIGFGYMASLKMNTEGLLFYTMAAIVGVIVGTFLFYRSIMTMFFKAVMKQEWFVFRRHRLLLFSNLWYRIGNNFKVYAAVTIFLTCTLTAISTVVSFNYSFEDIRKVQYPYSFYIQDDALGTKYQAISDYLFDEAMEIDYSNRSLEGFKINKIKNDVWRNESTMHVISESTFRRSIAEIPFVTKEAVLPKVSLKEDEVLLLDNPSSYITKGSIREIYIDDEVLKVLWVKRAPLFGRGYGDTLVVNDVTFARFYSTYGNSEMDYFSGIQLVDESSNQVLVEWIQKVYSDDSVSIILEENRETIMLIFIRLSFVFGVFLGLAFILATGSIIYFKIVSQAGEDVNTYALLHDMGLGENVMKRVINKQILMFFIIPLLLASIHTTVASRALERFLGISLLMPLGRSILVVGGLFFVYYLLTIFRYKQIVFKRLS